MTEIFVAVVVGETDGSSDNGYYENNGGEDAEDDDSHSEDLSVEWQVVSLDSVIWDDSSVVEVEVSTFFSFKDELKNEWIALPLGSLSPGRILEIVLSFSPESRNYFCILIVKLIRE